MGHNHNHSHGLSLAFWLNLGFSALELAGGLLTNSTAILADAFHDLMDALAIGAAVVLEKVSSRKRTPTFSYGYKRFSLLSALAMSALLLVGVVWMVFHALQSLIDPQPVHSIGMLWLAALGIGVNGLAYIKIKKAHQKDRRMPNHNRKAIMLHLLEDVLGWVAVCLGAIVIYFTAWYWIDGLLTLAIAAWIGLHASHNLHNTMKVLLQAVPESLSTTQIAQDLLMLDGVESIHDLHFWSLDGSHHVGTLHAVVNTNDPSRHQAIFQAINQILENHHIQHPTIQLETLSIACKRANCL